MRVILVAALALAAAAPARADAIDDYVRHQMAVSHIPGVAIAVVRRGRIETVRGYGLANLEWNAPVGPDTRFQTASATKIFTGLALMRLVEAAKLRLDATLDQFFPDAPPSWREITVLQLASHSSGLSDQLGEHDDNVAATVVAAMKAPLAYPPGTETRYGFTDFVVLRAVMEKVTGKDIAAIFRDEICAPLGLRDTGFAFERQYGPFRSALPLANRASIHAWKDGEQRVSSFLYGETGYSAGGLYSSARDFAALFAALDRGELLEPGSLRLLQTPPLLKSGKPAGFAVGWSAGSYHGVKTVGHSGGPALADILHADSEGLTVIALTNQQRFYPLLAQGVADFYLPPAPAPKAMADRMPALTGQMRSALAEAAAGKLDRTRYAAAAMDGLVPFLEDFGQALLVAVGPVQRVALIEDRADKGGRARRYAIDFERKRMFWLFATDAAGKIADLHPVGED
ncbi:CubicO group peptidase (beta-lactamase class C family) [Sphingomonas naasensis]|uniref:Class A beta-lactamase-related serine hydrolase n=1 Tax=Sphingomonas naasensis TaxID=1344951 RepID=A0A4S1WQP8_9SPHN|nr:serine hydrolase domain-containing protein [Sphingomonas naasensis]NIJ18397.1 CubicO group peptidase (beta-lactamase class C family) [Sphingomonas naasensis]TGX45664.1 class A beta-lactamase-related serine hydrolase [Sphingomonas naasensis]